MHYTWQSCCPVLDASAGHVLSLCLLARTVEVDQAATHSAQRYPLFARPELMKILRAHTERVLKPASDWDIAVSAGSMSALDHTVAMFLNPGDTILMEEFTFLAMVDACMAAGLHMVPVKCDDDGILPSELAKVIAGAKVLYTVPVGQNPLGTRMSCERYKAIYELCAAHDVIIVEDDAYYYLQHNSHDEKADEEVSAVAGLELGPSFISIDQKGLVFRLDTVSKMLSPGFRLGWVTGPKHFIKAFEQVCYISCQMGCSMSIVCLGKLLAHWNTEGLEAQMKRVQMCLRLRCRSLLRACEAHLKGLAQWSRPQAGMFLWLRMLRPRRFTLEELLESMARHKIVPMPGGFCSPVRTGEALPYFRLSYVISPEKYDMGLQRFRQAWEDTQMLSMQVVVQVQGVLERFQMAIAQQIQQLAMQQQYHQGMQQQLLQQVLQQQQEQKALLQKPKEGVSQSQAPSHWPQVFLQPPPAKHPALEKQEPLLQLPPLLQSIPPKSERPKSGASNDQAEAKEAKEATAALSAMLGLVKPCQERTDTADSPEASRNGSLNEVKEKDVIQEGNLQEREEPQEPKKGGDAEDREDHEPKEAKQQAQASAASAASEKMRREEDLRGSEQDSKESRQEEGKELREHEGEFNGDDVESCEKVTAAPRFRRRRLHRDRPEAESDGKLVWRQREQRGVEQQQVWRPVKTMGKAGPRQSQDQELVQVPKERRTTRGKMNRRMQR
ncbi:Aromatic amino acid aminotransferase C569.07 [Durusdinium trenchii]|uniref:Aromatic amino acid aminotransferase C569.07 n=1 Tax=Durusdinium trenchii TaxID=1381693 RepID=A0ABP0SFA5_9DINO